MVIITILTILLIALLAPKPVPYIADVPTQDWTRQTMTQAWTMPPMAILPTLAPTPLDASGLTATPVSNDAAATVAIGISEPYTEMLPLQAPPTPTPSIQFVKLSGIQHAWQTWNNCGPATLAMNLSYYGSAVDQSTIGATLRQHPDDKNVSPTELADFARSQGLQADVRVNGNSDTLKQLLDVGIPILIETWLDPDDAGGLGHYRLLVGYDDLLGVWIAYDSYVGENLVNPNGVYEGIYLPYAETETLWRIFNRTFVLIYEATDAATVEAILGPSVRNDMMWNEATQRAQFEIDEYPDDAYAWFNLGSSLSALGRFQEAARAFDRAQKIGLPWRMMWYQYGPFEAYYNVDRHQDVLTLADNTLSPEIQIEEIHYWRGKSLFAAGDVNGAQQAWQAAKRLNPSFAALMGIPLTGEN